MIVPPLKCPQCQSTKVKAGFTKRKGRAYVNDGRIWCYECNSVTDSKGKVEKHKYRSHIFEEEK